MTGETWDSDPFDPLHDEREEQRTERRYAPMPPGDFIRGTWYPPGRGPGAEDEE